jgi:hypothetical protein
VKFAFQNVEERFGHFPIKLDRLALLARHLPRFPSVRIDLHKDAAIAFKGRVSCRFHRAMKRGPGPSA